MRKVLAGLAVLLLAALTAAPQDKPKEEPSATAVRQESKLPEPAREGGYFQRGGADLGRGYGHGGAELGRGAAGFGKNLGHGEFGEAGRSMGRGAAGFGKGVGVGTARGFKNFALAFRNWGKKIDRSASDKSQSEAQSR